MASGSRECEVSQVVLLPIHAQGDAEIDHALSAFFLGWTASRA